MKTPEGACSRRIVALVVFAALAIPPTGTAVRRWSATANGYPLPDVRAAGLGGALVALADDPTALVWNPAGLVGLTYPTIGCDFSLAGPGTTSLLLGYPIGSYTTAGFGWMRSDVPPTSDGPESLERFSFGMAGKLGDRLDVGIAASYMNPAYRVAPDSVEEAIGISLSAGLNLHLTQRLRLGLALYDAADTKVSRSNGAIVPLSRRSVRWGFAYAPSDRFALTWQHDSADRIGMEWYPTSVLGLRAGAGRNAGAWDAGLGLSVRMSMIRADYGFERVRTGSDRHRVGLQAAFTGGRSAVQMDAIRLRALYASLANAYAREPVATVVLSNPSPTPVRVRVELNLPGIMDAPASEDVTVAPYGRRRVGIRAALSADAVASLANGPVPGTISVINPVNETVLSRQAVQTLFHRRGAITWDDTRKAAAFVTPEDPAVRAFVREALRPYRAWLRELPLEQEVIATATIIFEAAGVHGITYQPDSNSPYATARRRVSPVEMLRDIGAGTFDVATTPIGMVANPVKDVVRGGSDGDTVGVVGDAVTETSGLVTKIGALGEESLRLILYPYQRFVSPGDLQMVVDDVQYPAELLARRAGDCDDSTVLLCALLECAGISTAFVESPEHIFMMFDTRLPADRGPEILPGPPELFARYRGTYWIPLETTATSEGFAGAWRRAAAIVAMIAAGDSVPATAVADAWEVYDPLGSASAGETDASFDADSLDRRVRQARIDFIGLWDASPVGRLEADLARETGNDTLRAAVAYWLLHAGYLSRADEHLRALELSGFEPPRVLGLRAVYWHGSGDLDSAEDCARRALELAPWVADLRDLYDQIIAARRMEQPDTAAEANTLPAAAP